MPHSSKPWLALCALLLSVLLVPARLAADDDKEQDRVALVVGNSAYGSIVQLDNPQHDAELIARSLKALDFDVTLLLDANQITMKRAIAQFGRELRSKGPETVGLFYYAGHAVQSFRTNYLLPVDASLLDAADLDLVGVEAQSVLRQMFSAKNQTNIVILDACRNNPFTDIPEFNDNGLAEMDAPTGTFLAYATAPGGVALDGLEGNSPFTRSLAGFIGTPGMPIEQMFKQVRIEVLEETNGFQTPWDSSSLTNHFMFAPPDEASIASDQTEEQAWREAQASSSVEDLVTFLRTYPESIHKRDAQQLLTVVLEYDLGIAIDRTEDDASAASAGPTRMEERVFTLASADNSQTGFEFYLRLFPEGTYANLARQELEALRLEAQSDTPETTSEPLDQQAVEVPSRLVTFVDPLTSESPDVDGKSIAYLMNGSPLFSPLEDLPDEYWKGQSCNSCHQWSEDRLCDYAVRVLGRNTDYSRRLKHPYGGELKKNMRFWAAGGCQ